MARRGGKRINAGVETNPPLKDVARRAKASGKEVEKKLAKVNRDAAWEIVKEARRNAYDMGGVHEKAANAIKPANRRTAIALLATTTSQHPYALVAFLGAKRRTGWYGWRRYDKRKSWGAGELSRRRRRLAVDTFTNEVDADTGEVTGRKFRTGSFRGSKSGTAQHPAWIGNQWEVGAGSFGSEPYAINPAIRDKLDDVLDSWGTAVDAVLEAIYEDNQLY